MYYYLFRQLRIDLHLFIPDYASILASRGENDTKPLTVSHSFIDFCTETFCKRSGY